MEMFCLGLGEAFVALEMVDVALEMVDKAEQVCKEGLDGNWHHNVQKYLAKTMEE